VRISAIEGTPIAEQLEGRVRCIDDFATAYRRQATAGAGIAERSSAHVSGGAKNAVSAEKLNFSSARVE
jgi:hypothetical protein